MLALSRKQCLQLLANVGRIRCFTTRERYPISQGVDRVDMQHSTVFRRSDVNDEIKGDGRTGVFIGVGNVWPNAGWLSSTDDSCSTEPALRLVA